MLWKRLARLVQRICRNRLTAESAATGDLAPADRGPAMPGLPPDDPPGVQAGAPRGDLMIFPRCAGG
jgi:hypothetical protein